MADSAGAHSHVADQKTYILILLSVITPLAPAMKAARDQIEPPDPRGHPGLDSILSVSVLTLSERPHCLFVIDRIKCSELAEDS